MVRNMQDGLFTRHKWCEVRVRNGYQQGNIHKRPRGREWQIAGGRKKTGRQGVMGRREEQDITRISCKIGQVAFGTDKLSLPQLGMSPQTRGGSSMELYWFIVKYKYGKLRPNAISYICVTVMPVPCKSGQHMYLHKQYMYVKIEKEVQQQQSMGMHRNVIHTFDPCRLVYLTYTSNRWISQLSALLKRDWDARKEWTVCNFPHLF